jgi:hypothetical protein
MHNDHTPVLILLLATPAHNRFGAQPATVPIIHEFSPNKLKEHAAWLENRLLFELQRSVLQPQVVDYAIQEFERHLTASLAELSGQVVRVR